MLIEFFRLKKTSL